MESTVAWDGSFPRSLYLQLLLVAVIVFYIARPIFAAITDPLRKVPGPLATRFTKLWLGRHYLKGDFHKTNKGLHARYGAWLILSTLEEVLMR